MSDDQSQASEPGAAGSGQGRARAWAARALGWLPALAVLAFAAWLLWPVPRGHMPLSADHTVHLTRIQLTAQRLVNHGSLSGWEPTWFFGFPLGELYPQLGDLAIIVIHALGLGQLDWPAAYALGFYLVFALQGLALLRLGRLLGCGPWPGLVAAALMLADAGFTREGGWMYTVYFGVWPQALATSLAWLGLGELARGLGWPLTRTNPLASQPWPAKRSTGPPDSDSDTGEGTRATILAALCFGAALLAHPIALPTLALGGLCMVLTLVPRASLPWRQALARCLLVGALGLALAAWWWVPMWQHKAWMASYGWLFVPLELMQKWLVEDGRWAQRMPELVGYAALVGLGLAALGVGRVGRFVALFTGVQWLLASNDAFWTLRLDRISEGFTHIQYQRFLIGAKPGLFLLAGLAATVGVGWGLALLEARPRLRRPRLALGAAIASLLSALVATGALVQASAPVMAEHEVGEVQIERRTDDPEFEAHYQAYLAWAREQWDAREADYRVALDTPRNSHLFMDAPVWTKTPQYKQGFTPGDNFVHKPEAGSRELLDKLGVRWMVGADRPGQVRVRAGEVARFGPIWVRERARAAPRELAWLEGAGELELLEADLRGGLVRARVRGAEAGARVVFGIAGYPRWQLLLDGQPLEWIEVPVWGDGPVATQEARRGGELRGGKAEGDDGSEPTLIAAELPEGSAEAELELRYVERGRLEWLAELLSLLTLALLLLARVRSRPGAPSARLRERLLRLEQRLVAALHPLTLAVLAPALVGAVYGHWQLARAHEAVTVHGWVEQGHARVQQRVEPGPIKSEMLIRPALLMRPRPGKPAIVELELDELPSTLEGWIGIDDDQAKSPGRWVRHELRIEARWSGSEAAKWLEIARIEVPHEAERVHLELDSGPLTSLPVFLRVTDEVQGPRAPQLGLYLDLGVAPELGDD